MREEEKEKPVYPELEPTDEDEIKDPKKQVSFPWSALVIFGILAVLCAVCVIFIVVFGGPTNG